MTKNLISIIIPTYNRALLISKTLNSIISQTYSNWECIIIDDGSTDNTEEVVEAYCLKDSRFQYFKKPTHCLKGPNACRNYGFKLSVGDYINWFDSDDLYLPNALEQFVEIFDENTDVVVVKLEVIDFLTGKKIKENNIVSKNKIEDYFVGKIGFYVCGPLWKRSFLEQQSSLFDETIRNLDDWDFNLRMLYRKPVIKYINKPLIQYRYHENSLSQELAKLNFNEIQSEFAAREKHLQMLTQNNLANTTVLRKFIKNRYNYFFMEAMLQNHTKKYYFLKKLLYRQFYLFDIYGMLKTLTGFIVFSIFKKGYILLK
jgi:glycosyltransferase involved in cell wall biosynthesis